MEAGGGKEVMRMPTRILWEAFKRLPPHGKVLVAVYLAYKALVDDE